MASPDGGCRLVIHAQAEGSLQVSELAGTEETWTLELALEEGDEGALGSDAPLPLGSNPTEDFSLDSDARAAALVDQLAATGGTTAWVQTRIDDGPVADSMMVELDMPLSGLPLERLRRRGIGSGGSPTSRRATVSWEAIGCEL